MLHSSATRSDFIRTRPPREQYRYDSIGICAKCHTSILDIEHSFTYDGTMWHTDCGDRPIRCKHAVVADGECQDCYLDIT